MATVGLRQPSQNCPLCQELFTEPKIVPCGHLFCRNCLVDLVKTGADAVCPLCRGTIIERQEGQYQNVDKVPDSFPSDSAMTMLIESTQLLKREHRCYACENGAAVSLCLHCYVLLCPKCVTLHGKFPALKSHTLKQLETLTPESLASSRLFPCVTHSDRTAELLCPSHNVSVCNLCAATQHRSCPYIGLEDIFKNSRMALSEMKALLAEAENKLDETERELKDFLLLKDKSTEKVFLKIDATFDLLQNCLETRRQHLKEAAQKVHSEIQSAIMKKLAVLGQKRLKLTSYLTLMHRVQNTAPSSSISAMTSTLKDCILKLYTSDWLKADAINMAKVTMSMDDSALKRLQLEIAQSGQIAVVPVSRTEHKTWRFHVNHGRNISLRDNQQTADRTSNYCGGIVLSSKPLKINSLYEVRVDAVNVRHRGCLRIGVVVVDPAKLELPPDSSYLTSAIVIKGDAIVVNGAVTSDDYGQALTTVKPGSRVGVLIDSLSSLHLYVDGCDNGVAVADVPKTCYALFDVFGRNKMVTALPMTTTKKGDY